MKGIDAPEILKHAWAPIGQCPNQYRHGDLAKAALTRLLQPAVKIKMRGYYPPRIDELGRPNLDVIVNGADIGLHMLREGHATLAAFGCETPVSRFQKLRTAMMDARARERGIWNPDSPLLMEPDWYRYGRWLRWARILPGYIMSYRLIFAGEMRRRNRPEWRRLIPLENRVIFEEYDDRKGTEWENWTGAPQ
jgi:hypothetical protein